MSNGLGYKGRATTLLAPGSFRRGELGRAGWAREPGSDWLLLGFTLCLVTLSLGGGGCLTPFLGP